MALCVASHDDKSYPKSCSRLIKRGNLPSRQGQYIEFNKDNTNYVNIALGFADVLKTWSDFYISVDIYPYSVSSECILLGGIASLCLIFSTRTKIQLGTWTRVFDFGADPHPR